MYFAYKKLFFKLCVLNWLAILTYAAVLSEN